MKPPKQPTADLTDLRSNRTRARIDASDVLIFLGLALLGAGLWWLSPALALTIIGAILLLVGLVGAWMRGNRVET